MHLIKSRTEIMKDLIDFKKSYSMNAKIILIPVITLFFLLAGLGCDDVPSDYYKGKIIALNNHIAYYDVIEIQQGMKDGLPAGQTLAVGVQLTDKGYKLNEEVYFKIIRYQKSIGFETADHMWASYSGIIELYNK
jgi:hypothetical protein